MKIKSISKEKIDSPVFEDVREWYEKHLHPDANTYDDQSVYEKVYHNGGWAGIFQASSKGAQKLFMDAKPKTITDIAVITSIYRPGPLAAKVDKIYLDAKNHGKKFDWGHPLFETVLGETYNSLVFQEQVMSLAEHIGGFPKEKCDDVRRAIMKRDLSKGDAAIKEAQKMEDDFVSGAASKGIPESTARKAYQNILWFAGYGFNKSLYNLQSISIYKNGSNLQIKISDVEPGDFVDSRDEKTGNKTKVKVKKVLNNGVKPLVRVKLKNGKEVICSMNHKFRTTNGYVLSLAEIIQKKLSIQDQ